MKKKLYSISAAKLGSLLKKIKSIEDKGTLLKIGKLKATTFVAAHATLLNDKNDPKHIRTKRRILNIAGDFSTDPARLKPAVNLKTKPELWRR